MTDTKTYYHELTFVLGEDRVQRDEPMSRHISFRVGGPADLFLRVGDTAELEKVLGILQTAGVPYFFLGKGTNLLVGDRGYRGAVITFTGVKSQPLTDTTKELPAIEAGEFSEAAPLDTVCIAGEEITAGAGASLTRVAVMARDNGLSGLEFAAGIPGSVGGGLVMNAGAYDGEMRQVVKNARLLMPDGKILTVSDNDLRFGYRKSLLKEIPAVALQVTFRLTPKEPSAITEKMQDFANRRLAKQPLEYPSAGSTFKRPEGHFAGQLIEEAGLRGYTVGGAGVSEKHCGFVVNRDNASAAEIRQVIEDVQTKVLAHSGIRLEREVIFLGEF